MDTLYLKTSLNAFAPEYDRAVEDVLREKAAGKGVKGREEKKIWKELRAKYQAGAISTEDGARILIALKERVEELGKAPSMKNMGEFAVTRGCFAKTAELIKQDMDWHSGNDELAAKVQEEAEKREETPAEPKRMEPETAEKEAPVPEEPEPAPAEPEPAPAKEEAVPETPAAAEPEAVKPETPETKKKEKKKRPAGYGKKLAGRIIGIYLMVCWAFSMIALITGAMPHDDLVVPKVLLVTVVVLGGGYFLYRKCKK